MKFFHILLISLLLLQYVSPESNVSKTPNTLNHKAIPSSDPKKSLSMAQPILIPQPKPMTTRQVVERIIIGSIIATSIVLAINMVLSAPDLLHAQNSTVELYSAQLKLKKLPDIQEENDSQDITINMINQNEYDKIIQLAEQGLISKNRKDREIALQIFQELIVKMKESSYEAIINAANKAISCKTKPETQKDAITLLSLLLEKKGEILHQAIIKIALNCVQSTSVTTKVAGLELLKKILNSGFQLKPDEIKIIKEECSNHKEASIQEAFLSLVNKLPNTLIDIITLQTLIENTDDKVTQNILWITYHRINKETSAKEQESYAKIAEIGLRSKDLENKRIALLIYEKLIKIQPNNTTLKQEAKHKASKIKEDIPKKKLFPRSPQQKLLSAADKLLAQTTN